MTEKVFELPSDEVYDPAINLMTNALLNHLKKSENRIILMNTIL